MSSNTRLRRHGVDIPGRVQDRVPLGDIKMDKHEATIELEICHCYLVPFCVAPKKGEKPTHPIPVSEEALSGATLCKMTWTAKKDLLMADKERRWHLEI
jgi:hypothetical protein